MNMKTKNTTENADQRAAYSIRQRKEVDVNYDIFVAKHLDKLYKKHQGKFALMKDGKLLEIFDDIDDAIEEGNKRFADRVFSAHKITKEVAHLGIYSYA